MAAPFLEALRPKPFRGDVIAAGVVVLTTLVFLLAVRFDGDWSDGVHLAYEAAGALFVATLALLAPMERDAPRAYQSVLYVATVVLVLAVAAQLAETVADGAGTGQAAGVVAVGAATALVFAVARNSAISTLLASVGAGAALLLFVDWAFEDTSLATFRWLLVGLVAVLTLAALAQRDRRPAHAVALVDAAGLALVAIGCSLIAEGTIVGALFTEDQGAPAEAAAEEGGVVGWGWQLLLLAGGFGLIAYSSVDRERGPAYLGVIALLLFLLLAESGGFAGWPLLLLAIAVALLVVGLRPTTPAPPSPDADMPPAPTSPLR